MLVAPFSMNAQLVGKITSADGPVIGANVVATPGDRGVITDIDGNYSLDLGAGTYTVTVSYTGYANQKREVTLTEGQRMTWDITMSEDAEVLNELIVVGTRLAPRSSTSTPLPVDVLSAKELQSTGQTTFDKGLQYRVPSFNTVQTPVNDATALLDPYEIRNMGPSRTLVLINGKRKNSSSLIYTQTSPGKGESGADISAIPTDAIERVEILRDGASAQYGSDAIAGVMNIILKDDADLGSFTLRTGITHKGDGALIGLSVNDGVSTGENGFLNYTVDVSKVTLANRPGTVSAEGEIADFTDGSAEAIQEVNDFLALKPDAGNINGSPETTAAKFLVNGGIDVNKNLEMYYNAAYVYKKVNSFANYRTPYWRTTDYGLLTEPGQPYLGYLPTFEGDLNDYNGTVGFRSTKNGWISDASFTTGGNQQTYSVNNTVNHNLGKASPINFKPGGTAFSHNVGNIDITKALNDIISIGFGSEFRTENFEIIEGDTASYAQGGADSFAGNTSDVSNKFNRYNFGGYFDLGVDITEDFLINGTVRLENYSDFGNAFVWKASSRYKFLDDKMTLRGSVSSGFRAPSLHQIYVQKTQYSFVPGGGIEVEGLVNNVSPQAKLLGVPQLEAEKSLNFTVGVGARVNDHLSLTADYYNIRVNDRIILGNTVGRTGDATNPLDILLDDFGIVSVNYFSNAMDTRTSGVDFVANYRRVAVGPGQMNFNLSANYTIENQRIGDVRNPELIENSGQTVVDPTLEALMFTSRPKFKGILGIDYNIKDFTVTLGNTLFGPTKFRNAGMDRGLQIEFVTKVVTDLGLSYRLMDDKITLAFNANNIFNILPKWNFAALDADGEAILADAAATQNQSNLITFNQRYPTMTYDGYHFSQLGAMFNLSCNVRF